MWGQSVQQRQAQLMHPRERKLHLRLDPSRTRDANPRCPGGHVLQKRGLTDTGLTAEDQDTAFAASKRIDEPVERGALRELAHAG